MPTTVSSCALVNPIFTATVKPWRRVTGACQGLGSIRAQSYPKKADGLCWDLGRPDYATVSPSVHPEHAM